MMPICLWSMDATQLRSPVFSPSLGSGSVLSGTIGNLLLIQRLQVRDYCIYLLVCQLHVRHQRPGFVFRRVLEPLGEVVRGISQNARAYRIARRKIREARPHTRRGWGPRYRMAVHAGDLLEYL